ncbi:hypothetical protein ACLBWH_11085 [Sphingomonas sp. M6A6_1c]
MATLLGADFLTGVLENEVFRAAEEQLNGEIDDGVEAESEAQAHRADPVYFSLVLKGHPRLVGIRRGRRFLVLELDTALAALRVWDWVRWQSPAFAGWYAFAEAKGPIALEIMILDSTRLAEERARLEGYAADGARPLRNWRPDLRD